MMKPRGRVVLPFGHLTVDCLILVLWLGHIQSLYRPKAEVYPSPLTPVRLFQEAGQPAWNPKFISPPAAVAGGSDVETTTRHASGGSSLTLTLVSNLLDENRGRHAFSAKT